MERSWWKATIRDGTRGPVGLGVVEDLGDVGQSLLPMLLPRRFLWEHRGQSDYFVAFIADICDRNKAASSVHASVFQNT